MIKILKTVILLLTATLITFGLFACGNNNENSSSGNKDGEVKYLNNIKDSSGALDNSTIAIENGEYKIKDKSTFNFTNINCCNSNEGVFSGKFIYYLKNKNNVMIDGNNSKITLDDSLSFIYVDNCTSVTVKNFSFVYGENCQTETKSIFAFANKCQNIKFENIAVLNSLANGFYVQNTSNFELNNVEYSVKANQKNGNFLFVGDCVETITIQDNKVSNGVHLLKAYSSLNNESQNEQSISIISNEFNNFNNGIIIDGKCNLQIKNNTFDGIQNSLVKSDDSFYSNKTEPALLLESNVIKNSSSNLIDLNLTRKNELLKINKISVIDNNISNLKDDNYTINVGDIGRMIFSENTTDKNVNIIKNDNTQLEDNSKNPLVALAIGDSITYGACLIGDTDVWGTVKNNYFDLICDYLGVTRKENHAISGTCIVPDTYNTPLYEQALTKRVNLLKNGDIVFVSMGTNDFGCSVKIGNKTDTTDDTLYGSLDISFSCIKKNNPWAKVYIILPIPRVDVTVNRLNKTLEDYKFAIREKAMEYGFNVIDGGKFPIDCNDQTLKKEYMKDGVHPTEYGHIYYAQTVINAINNVDVSPLTFVNYVADIKTDEEYEVQTNFNGDKSSLTWESLDDNIAIVENGIVTGVNVGKVGIIAKDQKGNSAVIVINVKEKPTKAINNNVYLALSTTLGDESSSILYSFEGGPYRCNYMYAPEKEFLGNNNAVSFNITVRKTGGYLMVLDGSNNDISTAWGGDGGYQFAIAIGKDYCGTFSYRKGEGNFPLANNSIFNIVDLTTNEDLTGKNIDWKLNRTYKITYRLAKGHALSFFYTSSIYDTNSGSTCWGQWNGTSYCYDLPSSIEINNFKTTNMEGKAMVARTETFKVNGYNATVLIPENANGKWLWKTEFFYAFDTLEQSLYNEGFTRVYFEISDKYGSPNAVNLMYDFYKELMSRFDLDKKAIMLGFSRGALYAFNFTLAHPECVEKVYLDAPVLDLRSWPRTNPVYNEVYLHNQVMAEYGFKSEEEFLNYGGYPVGKLKEFFALNIPTLLVAGDSDTTVKFEENSKVMIDYCLENNIDLIYYVKVGSDHHPHSFGTVEMFGSSYQKTFDIYSSEIQGSSKENTTKVDSVVTIIDWFFKN